MLKHRMDQGQLAAHVGIDRSHLNNLIKKHPSRPLTAYYLGKFIQAGVIMPKEINDGKATDPREIKFWKTIGFEKGTDFLLAVPDILEFYPETDMDKFLRLMPFAIPD